MNQIRKKKPADLVRLALVLLSLICMTAFVAGCDDEKSTRAKLEEARIAIDDEEYNKAIALLDGMTSPEALEVLASAYAGKAGINTFDILSEVDDDGGSDDGNIDLIGKMLGTGDDNSLSQGTIDTKLDQMDMAKSLLVDSVDGALDQLDDDGKAKLGIYGYTDVVLLMGKIISAKTGGADVVLTEEAIDALPVTFTAEDITNIGTDPMPRLNGDLAHISRGITALGGDTNDLAEEFTAFFNEITQHDGVLTAQDLADYLNGDSRSA